MASMQEVGDCQRAATNHETQLVLAWPGDFAGIS